MTWRNWIAMVTTGLVVAWGTSSVTAVRADDRDGLMELLRETEIEMAAVSEHAAKLEQMVEWPNRYTLSLYKFEWSGIRNGLDNVGELIPKLRKASAGDWSEEAIDEMASLIKATEVQAEAAMKHLTDVTSVERLYADERYELRIGSIVHYADHVDALIEHIEDKKTRSS